VTNFPAATAKWQISTDGGRTPYWNADGSAILFLHHDRIMTAPVRAGSLFAVDLPRELESMGDRIAGFSVASNGTIVALRLIEEGKPRPLAVNHRRCWFDPDRAEYRTAVFVRHADHVDDGSCSAAIRKRRNCRPGIARPDGCFVSTVTLSTEGIGTSSTTLISIPLPAARA
jgi:hypothetical protein